MIWTCKDEKYSWLQTVKYILIVNGFEYAMIKNLSSGIVRIFIK